jgi:hypothetical protein
MHSLFLHLENRSTKESTFLSRPYDTRKRNIYLTIDEKEEQEEEERGKGERGKEKRKRPSLCPVEEEKEKIYRPETHQGDLVIR